MALIHLYAYEPYASFYFGQTFVSEDGVRTGNLLCVGVPYLVQLCVDLVDSSLGTLHLLRQLLLHALLLIQGLSDEQQGAR